MDQALNFFAFGTFSPLNILSAPTFLPLLGQPYFGPNILRKRPHEVPVNKTKAQVTMSTMFRDEIFIVSKDSNFN